MSDRPPDPTLRVADRPVGQDDAARASVDRALADQRERWERGGQDPVEAVLDRFPALRHDAEAILCLIFNEVVLREERGESPGADEFQRRFPHLAAPIALQFGMDEALRRDSFGPPTVKSAPSGAARSDGAAGQPRLPGYEILAELGRGGMGVVYKARQLGFNRVVAVKMILAGAGQADREERFRTEAEAVARLHHPHIVQVYEVGEFEGQPFFSMEFCPGGGLDRKLNGTPLPPREAAPLVEKLARAVHAAHEAHVVHRDLKPANVLLDADGTPKITDFGLAKKLDEQSGQTHSGSVMGTPSYMAPEQAGGKSKEIGPAADVYALGAILYECLTGRPPFKAASLLETLAQVAADDPVPPRRLQPKTPRDLETVCLKCLEKAPARRYATALALADDLRRFAAGEPVRARRVGAAERAWRWARTHKTLAVLAAVALAALPTGAVLAWQAAAQSLDLTHRGEHDLDEAAKLASQSRWGEARAVLRQARERLERVGRADLLGKARQVSDDLETAARLEDAPLLRMAPGREGWDLEGADRAYREAFAAYGLDLGAMDPAAAAARIRASAIKDRLTEALDDWILNGRDGDELVRPGAVAPGEAPADVADQKGDDTLRRRLFEVVRQADPDEWRCRVRTAALNNDRAGLARLADDPTAGQPSPAMTVLLCEALIRTGGRPKALALLRAAQQRNPDHFWLNYDLGYNLDQSRGSAQEEAVGFLRAALALRPANAAVHQQLGAALMYREKAAEAEAEYRKAVEIRPDFAAAHASLGYVLNEEGHGDEAETECRKALQLSPDLSGAHNNLGYVLLGQSRLAEAEAEYRKALESRPNSANAYNGLGQALAARGRYDEAKVEYLRAIRIQPDYAHAHLNLGAALTNLWLLGPAEAEYRKALEFKPHYASAYLNLTRDLIRQGRFADALEAARTWRRETPPGDAAEKAASTEVQDCERVAAWGSKLPAVVRGEAQPSSAYERLVYGRLCWWKGLYGASVRLCSDAFAADPKLAENLSAEDRYHAARGAVLAAGGQGQDAKQAGDEDRARWRRQALDWLQADLAQWAKRQESDDEKSQAAVERTMRGWRIDAALAGVRDADKLAALPEAEREPWRKLWADVDDLIRRAAAPKPKGP